MGKDIRSPSSSDCKNIEAILLKAFGAFADCGVEKTTSNDILLEFFEETISYAEDNALVSSEAFEMARHLMEKSKNVLLGPDYNDIRIIVESTISSFGEHGIDIAESQKITLGLMKGIVDYAEQNDFASYEIFSTVCLMLMGFPTHY